MNIKDIYEYNKNIHEKTKQLAASLNEAQTAALADNEKWTVAHIFEHMAIVKDGMVKISAKLLNAAQAAGKTADGTAILSENFQTKAAEALKNKLEAPERVRPSGGQTIAESLAKMDETEVILKDLLPLFETVECSDFKFPHPFMGELSAHEWLTLVGRHEARHLMQIENILEKMAK